METEGEDPRIPAMTNLLLTRISDLHPAADMQRSHGQGTRHVSDDLPRIEFDAHQHKAGRDRLPERPIEDACIDEVMADFALPAAIAHNPAGDHLSTLTTAIHHDGRER